ncbi:MAG: 16S rRNA (adenine(1518)-N(6)/adenine(1519)-N(6))-dimethyltransferase RsmA [Thermodesulfovibrionales bacterium]|nr:16S rRNA (adenine(1518)-N(6)/adenine(1519)-N(6))-dimethyltransferase RsmA [Thermodesulfovibrionales bacterium]
MAKRYLGQNFLYDPSILRRIVQVAQLSREDLVVEIGPGPGRLTRMLAEKVKKVIAIELDDKLFEELKAGLAEYKNVELIHGDALKYSYENLPEFKVVANIPYYITTPIIFRLLGAKKNLISVTLTLQKEVAERIVAAPGGKDYGLLSIMVQYCTEPRLKFIIPKGAFRPVPRVDSAVVHIKVLERPSAFVKDEEFFFRVVKTAFSQRRKMLSNSLKSLREDIKERLAEAGIDSNRRPETLSIEEFARLSNILLKGY